MWGAVLGQPPDSDADPAHPELGEAFASAQNAVVAAIATYASVDIAASAPQVSGSVSTKWGASTLVQLYSLSLIHICRSFRATAAPTAGLPNSSSSSAPWPRAPAWWRSAAARVSQPCSCLLYTSRCV